MKTKLLLAGMALSSIMGSTAAFAATAPNQANIDYYGQHLTQKDATITDEAWIATFARINKDLSIHLKSNTANKPFVSGNAKPSGAAALVDLNAYDLAYGGWVQDAKLAPTIAKEVKTTETLLLSDKSVPKSQKDLYNVALLDIKTAYLVSSGKIPAQVESKVYQSKVGQMLNR
jgi:hypothetical protein